MIRVLKHTCYKAENLPIDYFMSKHLQHGRALRFLLRHANFEFLNFAAVALMLRDDKSASCLYTLFAEFVLVDNSQAQFNSKLDKLQPPQFAQTGATRASSMQVVYFPHC